MIALKSLSWICVLPGNNVFVLCVCVCADGASDPDAEPDEGKTDGHADCLVQRVPEVLWHFLHFNHSGTHCRVSFVTENGFGNKHKHSLMHSEDKHVLTCMWWL